VRDDIVIQIVKREIDNLQKDKKSFIIEGFPKTRLQALALQRAGIIPDAFLILNLPQRRLEQSCE
jgi:adenylate kinase